MESRLIHGDCINELRQLPDDSVDLICTDPPYGDNFAYGRFARVGNEHPLLGLMALAEGYRILRTNRCCFCFLDAKHLAFIDTFVRRYTNGGLRKVGWHTLRHTFASHLATKGVPMTAIQQLMGHSNFTTTMRYSHLAPSTFDQQSKCLTQKQHSKRILVSRWSTGVEMQQQEMIAKSAALKNA
jgi:hypothetical protein